MEKKRLILKLDGDSVSYIRENRKSFREPIFSFVSPPFEGRVSCVTGLTYCRESFCEYVRQELRGVRHSGIDLSKLHMVAYRKVMTVEGNLGAFRNQMAAAQTMFNAIEKHYGWPLTKVYPVRVTQSLSDNCKFFYIAASKRWIKAPAMLSLFTLLLRIAASESKFKFKHRIKSMKSLFTVLDELTERSSYPEIRYYAEHGHNWKLVLDNYRKLFSSRDMQDLYFPGKSGYFFSEGINQLCDVSSLDDTLNETFEELVKKRAGVKS